MKLSKLQIAINLIIWLVITIYLFGSYTFKDVIFFWLLWGISYNLQVVIHEIASFYLVWRHALRTQLMMSKLEPQEIVEAAVKVYDRDGSIMPLDEFNKYYEKLGDAVGARVWKGEYGVNELSARNIAANFLGMGNDLEVMEFIQRTMSKKDSE